MTVQRPTARSGRPRLPAPEIIAGALTVAVLAIVVGTSMAGGSSPASNGATARPTLSATPEAAAWEPPVDERAVELLRRVNGDLAQNAEVLRREIARTTLRTDVVKQEIVEVNGRVRDGITALASLDGALGEDQPGGQLGAIYRAIEAQAADTLAASVRFDAAYRSGATALVKLIDRLPPLQAALDALLVAPSPSPSASAASPSPSAPPSSAPPPSPSASAAPSSAAPSDVPASGSPSPFAPGGPEPSRAPDEQIDNPGFEEPIGQEWRFLPGSGATLNLDIDAPATGSKSARIDIATASLSYGAVTLSQPGLEVQAGRNYKLTLSVKATSNRDIRIRVVTPTVPFSRIVPVTTVWTQVTLDVTMVATEAAILEIQFGRSDETTWIDTVSFRPAPAF